MHGVQVPTHYPTMLLKPPGDIKERNDTFCYLGVFVTRPEVHISRPAVLLEAMQ
jgi:hypothetical protein